MTDFSQFYTVAEVNIDEEEIQLIQEAKQLYTKNGLLTPEDCLTFMQVLRTSLAQEKGLDATSDMSIELTTMGAHSHYDVALFEEDEPCIFLYIEGWGNKPLVLPQNIIHILGAKMDPNSISRKMYQLYNEEDPDKAIDHDMLYSEMLTLLDLCSEVKTELHVQTVPCMYSDGSQFISLVLESPKFKDLVVIPLDIFTMITVLNDDSI